MLRRRAASTAFSALLIVVATGIGSCDEKCRSYELRGTVNKWSGHTLQDLPVVVRLGYQYHVATQSDQIVVYREVSELFATTTDRNGRFIIHRSMPVPFESVDEKTVKVSLVYPAQKLGDIALEPARIRPFNEDGKCGLETSFIARRPARADDKGFAQRRIEQEVTAAQGQSREVFVNGRSR